MNDLKILFFSPFARISEHAIAENAVFRWLSKQKNYSCKVISCGSAFKGQCVTLDALGYGQAPAAKIQQTCSDCTLCAQKLFKVDATIEELFNQHNHLEIINGHLSGIDGSNILDFTLDGISIGRLATYQHLISFKKISTDFTKSEEAILKKEVYHCLKTYFALKEFEAKNAFKPDILLTYNSLYSVNAVACEFFRLRGARIYSMHAGPNLHYFADTVHFMKDGVFSHISRLKTSSDWQKTRIDKSSIHWVNQHFKELSKGESVFAYSPGNDKKQRKSIRDYWKIPKDKKLIVAALSSYDERFAAEICGALQPLSDTLFKTQIDWVQWLKEFAKAQPNLHIIVRIHPREFPNKRENVTSIHAQKIMKALEGSPQNLSLNIPSDEVSLYDLIPETDLALTAWSSVGKEYSLFGIPVVLFSAEAQWYSPNLGKVAKNLDDYKSLILSSVSEGWSIETSTAAYRWLIFESFANVFEMSTRFSQGRTSDFMKFLWRVANKILGQPRLIRLRRGYLKKAKTLNIMLETARLKSDIEWRDQKVASERKLVIEGLKQIAELMYGRQNWPPKIRKFLQELI